MNTRAHVSGPETLDTVVLRERGAVEHASPRAAVPLGVARSQPLARGFLPPVTPPDLLHAHPSLTAAWIPPGETVVVDGRELPGGMLYIGRDCVPQRDPSVIVPGFAVDRRNIDRAGAAMRYWPSYTTIPPACRAAYLEWLGGGRRDGSFGVGYAFLFFAGLERRLLREGDECSADEVAAIVAEVQRLLGLYQENRSFGRYATSFITAMSAARPASRVYEGTPPDSSAPTLVLRVGVAQASEDRQPLPAAWALAWCLADPPRVAARVPEEFARLFLARYESVAHQPVAPPPSTPRITVTYRPASSAFAEDVTIRTQLPDVAACGLPSRIAELAASCARDLEAYVRAARRGTGGSVPRVALLPPEIAPPAEKERRSSLAAWLEKTVPPDAPLLVAAGSVLSRWVESPPSKLARNDALALAMVLERLGFGIDPDPRFGGRSVAAEDDVALFRLPPDARPEPSAAYAAAELVAQLSAAVVSAADDALASDRVCVEMIASAMEGVTPTERIRLRAHALRRFATRGMPRSIAKRVVAFSPDSRERLGALLVRVAAADGRPAPKRVAVLVKVFYALGLDPAAVYRQAHALATDTAPAREPVAVCRAAGTRAASAFVIPAPEPRATTGRIDDALLARTHEEADEVLTMLAEIFADEPAVRGESSRASPSAAIPGLDARHAELARRTAECASWSRAEFESVCRDLGLLPDGALEVLNDAAFESVGAPVVEGDDPLEVDQAAIRRWMR